MKKLVILLGVGLFFSNAFAEPAASAEQHAQTEVLRTLRAESPKEKRGFRIFGSTLKCELSDFGLIYGQTDATGWSTQCYRTEDGQRFSARIYSFGAQFGGTLDQVRIWCTSDDPRGTYGGVKVGLAAGLGLKASAFVGSWGRNCWLGGGGIGGRIDLSGAILEVQ